MVKLNITYEIHIFINIFSITDLLYIIIIYKVVFCLFSKCYLKHYYLKCIIKKKSISEEKLIRSCDKIYLFLFDTVT